MNKSTEWVTVPREPTEAMMSVIGGTTLQAKIWKAMLAAAPTPPSADSAQDVGELVEAMRKLEGAFCQFLNEAGDPFEPVDQWRESVAKAFCDLSRAWNDAYAKGLSSETLAAYKRSTTDGKS